MACTLMMIGNKASNDGSTIIARNEDCENGDFNPKKLVVVKPEDQPREYTGVNSHLTIKLPDNPMRYTCSPNVDSSDGVWGEAGINEANVAMSATETISSNARVLGADPLVTYDPETGTPGGIGEEDLVTIILPYVKTAREGCLRFGKLLETYGTYEMNGIAFADETEVWYIESIGGHHWIARRVPDDCYCVQPNRQGIDKLDFSDAYGAQKDYMCSADLAQWMAENFVDVSYGVPKLLRSDKYFGLPVVINPRDAFSSRTWFDMVYNNPRAWYIYATLNNTTPEFRGPEPKYKVESMDIPWCIKPERLITVEDVKQMLGTTYNGTKYNCYGNLGDEGSRRLYRQVGINRTCECSILNIRPYAPDAAKAVQWIAMGSGPFNTAIAISTSVDEVPEYLDTTMRISTDDFYWAIRLISGLADPEFFANENAITGYQQATMALGYQSLHSVDAELAKGGSDAMGVLKAANQRLCDAVMRQTDDLLSSVLYTRSMEMKNRFSASDH